MHTRRRLSFNWLLLALAMISYPATAELNCNVGIKFYPDGGIKSCNLNGNHQIYTAQGQRLTCADGYILVQYPDGKLQSCTVAVPVSLGSVRCDRLSRVELGPDGTVKECRRL
jgi:hypothetical protein